MEAHARVLPQETLQYPMTIPLCKYQHVEDLTTKSTITALLQEINPGLRISIFFQIWPQNHFLKVYTTTKVEKSDTRLKAF
jgi:hypothetical protein